MARAVAVLFLAIAVGVSAGIYVTAGRVAGPTIDILQPTSLVGRSASFEATVEAPLGQLTTLDAAIEQDGISYFLFSLDRPADAEVRQDSLDRIRISRTFDRTSHPELRSGNARVVVTATRPVLFGLRETSSSIAIDVEVDLDPPRLAVLSRFHYGQHGGSELVVYRVTPPNAVSGVRVGDRFFADIRPAVLV